MPQYEAEKPSSLPENLANGEASWMWLRQRLAPESLARLEDWFRAELAELEHTYAHLVTPLSRKRQQRQELMSSMRSNC